MGHVMAQLLYSEFGIRARIGLAGHEPNHAALINGEIDLYADYLGTAVRRYLGLTPPRRAAATYRTVRDNARKRWGIEWLPAFGFNNTYAVVMKRTMAETLGVRTVSDLVPLASALRLGGTADFLAGNPKVTFAPGGYGALCAAYGLTFGRAVDLAADYGATFEALAADQVDLIVDFPVNPRMVSLDLLELRDTRHFFAPYFAAPVVSGQFLAEHPDARAVLARLAGRVDNRRAACMNYAVEMLGQSHESVAADLASEINAGVRNGGRARRANHH